MNDDFDLKQLADIGDPFAEDARAPVRPMDPARAPRGRSPTRSRMRVLRGVALAAALFYDASWLLFHERRGDLTQQPPAGLALGIAIPLAAASVALAGAVRRGPRGLGAPATRLAALAIGAPVLFALGTLLAAPPETGDPLFWRHAAGCMAVTGLLALGPLALGLWAFRHAFAAAAGWRTAAVGVAAGGLAAATMSLACPITTAAHVIVGHGLMMLIAGLAGALLAPVLARS
jgi:hypothetical protein